jgi:Tat protein secretion system quality control protein TatD with DNase activity
MRRILALGSLVSFTGILTFKNGQNIRDTIQRVQKAYRPNRARTGGGLHPGR